MSREKTIYPAREAREKAGFTTKAAAKRLHISPEYLLRLEREGFPFHQAERAARIFEAPLTAFLGGRRQSSTSPSTGGKTGRGKRERARRRPSPSPEAGDLAPPSQSDQS